MDETKERGEDEILAAELDVQVDGKPRKVRVLRIGEARVWKRALLAAVAGGTGIARMGLESLADGGDVVSAFGDRVLELVVAYDVDAAMGGREYLEAHASDGEAYAAFRAMLRVSFPFARDLRTAVAELRALGLADLIAAGQSVAGSQPASSTPGHSETGPSVLAASTSS